VILGCRPLSLDALAGNNDSSIDVSHVASAWRTLHESIRTSAAPSPVVPPPGIANRPLPQPRAEPSASASCASSGEDAAVQLVRHLRGSAVASEASDTQSDAGARAGAGHTEVAPGASDATFLRAETSAASSAFHPSSVPPATGTTPSRDASGICTSNSQACASLFSSPGNADPPADTPDRALQSLVPAATPEPSPAVTLATCGFATSTMDASSVRPSPMLHSPRKTTSPSQTLRSAVPGPTPADPRSAEPLLPTHSLARSKHGGAALAAVLHSGTEIGDGVCAAMGQSLAHVRFCDRDDPLFQHSRPAPPQRNASTPRASALLTLPQSQQQQDGCQARDKAAPTPTRDVSPAPAPRQPVRGSGATPSQSLSMSLRGSYCTAYQETWHEAMASYRAAKRRAPPPHRRSPSKPSNGGYKPFEPSLLRITPPELAARTSPAPPAAPEPSPAGSAAGYARTLPPVSPSRSHARSVSFGGGSLVSPSPKPQRLSTLWGGSGRTPSPPLVVASPYALDGTPSAGSARVGDDGRLGLPAPPGTGMETPTKLHNGVAAGRKQWWAQKLGRIFSKKG
jgi:hypothetical protein